MGTFHSSLGSLNQLLNVLLGLECKKTLGAKKIRHKALTNSLYDYNF